MPTIHKLADLQEHDFDTEYRKVYEQTCEKLTFELDRVNDYSKHPELDAGNHPSDYETLSDAEKVALRYWIDHAIAPSGRVNNRRTSYVLKHQFEREGFYITNGQFKGAMLLAGYMPVNIYALNWCFSIHQQLKMSGILSEQHNLQWHYTIGFDKEYVKLLFRAAPHLFTGIEAEA